MKGAGEKAILQTITYTFDVRHPQDGLQEEMSEQYSLEEKLQRMR